MDAIFSSFVQLLLALWQFGIALIALVVPWTPLLAWVAFWLYAVNWVKLTRVLLQGGLIAVIFLGLVATLVWGVAAPPEEGVHRLLGLTVGNFTGKFVYVTALIVIMMLCGSVQLAGLCGSWASFPEPALEPEHGHDHHSGDHGHGEPHLTIHAH